jgi:curli biogenesis system outer membrane secretion channel CsgG
MTRSGMVGMDLQLVDGRSGRIVRGYNCAGTFKTVSATSGLSVFGIGGGDSAFAASALGQATRAAMNDALRQTSDALAMAPR